MTGGRMHGHFDAHAAFEHVVSLSALRRLPGTPGEKEARLYIERAGREAGVEMRVEEFAYSSAPLKVILPLLCLALSLLCVAGSLACLAGTAFAALPGALLAVAVVLGLKWSGGFEYYAARGGTGRSWNVVGRIPAVEDAAGTVMLSAHYDAKSQVFPVVVRAVLFVVGLAGALLLGVFLVVAGIMKAAGVDIMGNPVGFYLTLAPALPLLALVFNFTGNRSPGALDNASGEAIILETARALSGEPLRRLDVLVVSFGCEEIGLCGSIDYLLAHGEELRARPFYMLNFDMPFSSSGAVGLNTGFEIPTRPTSEKLNRLARAAAERMGIELRGILLPVGAAADHVPWARHGFEATCFVAASTHVHRASDTAARVNREGLRRAGELALTVLRDLDQEEASGSS